MAYDAFKERRCGTCIFWFAPQCRRFPPIHASPAGYSGYGRWPETQVDFVCGEHRPAGSMKTVFQP